MVRSCLFAMAAISVPAPAVAAAPVWEKPVEFATGGGAKGPWRQNDSRYDYVDDATVAFGAGGGLYLAWADQGGVGCRRDAASAAGALKPEDRDVPPNRPRR